MHNQLVTLILQTWIIRRYPAEMLVTLICSIIVAILSSVVSLMVEKDPNAWKIGFNMELIATVYTVSIDSNKNTRQTQQLGLERNLMMYLLICRQLSQQHFEVWFTNGRCGRKGLSTFPCLSHLRWSLLLLWGSPFQVTNFILEGQNNFFMQ